MPNKINIIIKEETRRVLLEVTMEQAEARFNSKAFRKAMIKVNEILGYDKDTELELLKAACIRNIKDSISNDIPEKFKADALWWAISTFIETVKFGAVGSRKKALETFFQIKETGKGSILSQQDINQIQSWDELKEIVEQAKPDWEEYKQSKASKDWEAGSNLIYEDDTWQVFIPENKGAACKLGKGTEWCTAAPGLEYYEQYHKPENPLIIFINKQDPTDKYQFHYKTSQFMDKNDRSIKEKLLFYKLNQIVKSLSDKLPKQVIKKANQWSYEELPDGGYKITKPDLIEWFNENGEFHRLDGPAREWPDGTKRWYQMGKLHRLDGPAIEYPDGTKQWYQNDQLHRLDGPAFEWSDGSEEWYQWGKPHRLDGPAREWLDGTKQWWIEGKKYSEQDFNQKVEELEAQQNLREHFMRFM